ncbi:transcription factor [Clostridium butyricum]|uniref:transcription factor n=1 Tax=Clostridium butyricum TaxID=1492 RepID=UPI002AB30451|nr:transcription factor [Clostridium butyricum]
MQEPVLISRKTLAERWDFESTKVIENYEKTGIITRVPGLPTPRYSLDEIIQIENAGFNINPLSPLERIKKDKLIESKDRKIEQLEAKINQIRLVLT